MVDNVSTKTTDFFPLNPPPAQTQESHNPKHVSGKVLLLMVGVVPVSVDTPVLGSRVFVVIRCIKYLGTIKYIGEFKGHSGVWCGIALDSAGKQDKGDVIGGNHNGTIEYVKYFACKQGHGKRLLSDDLRYHDSS